MNCKQAEELLPLYAGNDLDERHARSVTEHLQTCAACTRVAAEYREGFQLMQQIAAPVFSEDVYAGVRRDVLREIDAGTSAPAMLQPLANLFRPRLTWAVASALLIAVSLFAIYFIGKRSADPPPLADRQQPSVQPSTTDPGDRTSPGERKPRIASSANEDNHDAKGVRPGRRKSLRQIDVQPNVVASTSVNSQSTSNPGVAPSMDSKSSDAAPAEKPMRVEIQTSNPNIRIIWFTQQPANTIVPNSKGL